MAGSNSGKVIKPISECFIKPKYEVKASKQPYYLSAPDLIFLDAPYMKRGFLFTKPTSSFNINSFTGKLQRALSHALVHFYPLAGRFVTEMYEDEPACWIYLDCNKGSGARFIHAACDTVTVADVVSPDPNLDPDIHGFFDLGERGIVNHDGHTRALASIQVTELIDGIFIAISMSHSLGDGSSFWHFINTLSEIFEQLDNNNEESVMISRVPIFNPIFPQGYGPIIKLPYPNMFLTRTTPVSEQITVIKTFHLSPTSVMSLKTLANNDKSVTCGQISSFQSIAALLWRSINRARTLDPEVVTIMNLLADARPRFNPPLSADHFGNMILRIQGKSKVSELLSNRLSWAAIILNQAIAAKNGKVSRDKDKFVVDLLLKGQRFPSGSQDTSEVTIGGSTRFNIYGSEFGLGKAVAVRTEFSGKKDGAITANPGRDGGGSVDLEVSLLPETMSALERDEEFMSFVS